MADLYMVDIRVSESWHLKAGGTWGSVLSSSLKNHSKDNRSPFEVRKNCWVMFEKPPVSV
jgi:hypothetical protein